MIKVVFTYRTKTKDLPELMEKFKQSLDPKFKAPTVSNQGIKRYTRVDGDDTYIVLDIFYNSREDYRIRTEHERSIDDWNHIWFNPNNKHTEVSVEVFDVISDPK